MRAIHPVTSSGVSLSRHPACNVPTPESLFRSELSEPLRVLVVEDDALIGLLLGDMLTLMGHDVCAIESTETGAVASAARFRPGIMIVDAWLREGCGITAVDRILTTGFVPHVFVTGDQRGVSELRPGAVVISKPFTEAMLVDAIEIARRHTIDL